MPVLPELFSAAPLRHAKPMLSPFKSTTSTINTPNIAHHISFHVSVLAAWGGAATAVALISSASRAARSSLAR